MNSISQETLCVIFAGAMTCMPLSYYRRYRDRRVTVSTGRATMKPTFM